MNGPAKIIGTVRLGGFLARSPGLSRALCRSVRSRETRPLRWQQSSAQQVQVRQGKGREQPCGVLRETPVAHLVEPPQALDHVKDMFATCASPRAQSIDRSLMLGERPARGAPVDAIADAQRLGALSMRLVPVGLIAEHFALLPVQELRDLRAVV